MAALMQGNVPYVQGREGVRRTLCIAILTGNHPQLAAVIGQRHDRDRRFGDALVARCGHFVLRRKVDPQLHHLQLTALAREGIGVKLFMQNARTGGHPLHIARTNYATFTG
ncbi:hypothetical protein D3C80_1683570 [compost metagenome]